MSNVAVIQPKPQLVAGDRPSAIVPTNIEQVWRFAELVAKSGMAPKGLEKPETITVAIMHGLEIGLTPLMALQRIAVVNGRPTIWGDAAMALVRASGLCEYAREVVKDDGDKMVAICTVKRRDETESATREFSVSDAKKAGLWGKAGPWQQYPKRMLQMRARAFALRDTFADVLGGLYLREEIEDREPRDITPREEPPAPPPLIEAPHAVPEASADAPKAEPEPQAPAPAATAPDVAPHPNADPEAFVQFILARFAQAKDVDALIAAWDAHVEPVKSALFPPDEEDLMSAFRKREHELA